MVKWLEMFTVFVYKDINSLSYKGNTHYKTNELQTQINKTKENSTTTLQ